MKNFFLISIISTLLVLCLTNLSCADSNTRSNFIAKNNPALKNNVKKTTLAKDNIVTNSQENTNTFKQFVAKLQIFKYSIISLETYSGLWVEVAKKNTKYSSLCYMVFAQYTLNPDNTFSLNTYCVDKDEENILTTQSTSKALDKFNTTFEVKNQSRMFRILVGNIVYRIYYINPDRSMIIVGTLDKKFLSILSRDELTQEETQEILSKAVELGFDITDIELTDTNREKFALYSSQVGY